MYYPEPFIASPTLINDDIWFLHITIYQYWLWFIFISLIVFFFLGFLITLRWCNIRHRPARETRGVSRSKCGDLITATVPVSWAASIIIHESTDAIEFADGFGSTDVAIGIRAYQWGWEYYYPKGLSLTNELNGTLFLGDSLTNSTNGVEDNYPLFKSTQLTSDFLTNGVSANTLNLLSLTSDASTTTLTDYNFGSNKLIARRATNLLETNVSLSLDQILTLSSPTDLGLSRLYTTFKNHVWEQSFPDKPSYVNHQLSFFSTKAGFYNATNFLNWHDWSTLSILRSFTEQAQFTPETDVLTELPTNLQTKRVFASLASWSLTNSLNWGSALIADQDFKRWAAFDLLDDLFWTPADWSSSTYPFVSTYQEQTTDWASYVLPIPVTDLTWLELVYPNTTYQPQILPVNANLSPALTQLWAEAEWLQDPLNAVTLKQWKNTQLILSLTGASVVTYPTTSKTVTSLSDLLMGFAAITSPLNLSLGGASTVNDSADWLVNWRNLITYFNAFWKVFKPSLDEQRGTFFSQNFSNTQPRLPIIGQTTPSLLNKVQKNNHSGFAALLTLKTQPALRTNILNDSVVLHLMPFFSFPFNLSFESDSIRYSWFDWYSTRNSIVAKAMDTSVFNLHASRDYSFTFNSTTVSSNLINLYENYFLKYSHARKFYLPTHLYVPFFLSLRADSLSSCWVTSRNSSLFTNYLRLLGMRSSSTAPTITTNAANYGWSASISALRPFLEPLNFTHNSVTAPLLLSDINVRRTYLLNSIQNQPHSKLSKLNSCGLAELIRQIVPSNQNSTKLVKYRNSAGGANELTSPLVSQYRPLKKGIVNMIRIQADRAVAMPTDTRLQLLAVSKDIIHSWAIPAAGIKIDCIPGYSSHRVAIFTLSGIYWGQCMEICGRFHHWMPIVVYFLRRDLFCLWCVHFIFKNNQTNSTLQSLAHQSTDTSSLVSCADLNVWSYLR